MLLLLMGYGVSTPVVVEPVVRSWTLSARITAWTLRRRHTALTLNDRDTTWTVDER